MLVSACNLVHDSVIATSRDRVSFTIYIYNHSENHFSEIHHSSLCDAVSVCVGGEVDDEVLDVYVSEVSEDANKFLTVIISKLCFHIISGNTHGSIFYSKTCVHSTKNKFPRTINTVYIPLQKQLLCFWDDTICVCNPDEDESNLSIKRTALKTDSTKQFSSLQQDQFITKQVLASSNNGSNIFILERSLISGCHALKCCEVSETGDALVWWDADVCSPHVSVARTSVYNSDDAVLLAMGCDICVYTLDGLLCTLSLKSALKNDDDVTAVQWLHTHNNDSNMQYPPYIENIQFLVSTLLGDLFLCAVDLPGEDFDQIYLQAPSLTVKRMFTSCGQYCFFDSSKQIIPDFTARQPFLPYFDVMSVLQLGSSVMAKSPSESGVTYQEGLLLASHGSFGVQTIQFSPVSFDDYEDEQNVKSGHHVHSTSMYSLLDSFRQVDKILPLPDCKSLSPVSKFLRYVTDYDYPIPPTLESNNDVMCGGPGSSYSSVLYHTEHGYPLLSSRSNEYQLDVSRYSRPMRVFTVICDVPLDIIPITQRSYSNNWSTAVILSSDSLCESSLFSINHAGKFQAVMDQTDIIDDEATLSLFRLCTHSVVQVTKSYINVLQLKNFRRSDLSMKRSITGMNFPSGSFFQNVSSSISLWTKDKHQGVTSKLPNKTTQQCPTVFAITSQRKLSLIQMTENKSKVDSSITCSMKEVYTHTMQSDIYSLSLSEDYEEVNREKKMVLAVCTWDSQRSLQIISVLLSKGSCCILSIISSEDMQLNPSLGDFYAGSESISSLPFKYLHVCPTLQARFMTNKQRCFVVGGCIDGHMVVFEYEYQSDTCVWKEINQWSSFVKGGIQDITLLNFFNIEHLNIEKSTVSRKSEHMSPEENLSNIHANAFIVNGIQGDFLYKFKLCVAPNDPLSILSSMQRTRILRQSNRRSQLCAIHPLYISPMRKTCKEDSVDNEHIYVDNFLWLSSLEGDVDYHDDDVFHLCIGSKSLYHLSPLPFLITKSKRVSFRVLNMIHLNNYTSIGGDVSRTATGSSYVLIMYSLLGESITCPSKVSVQVLDCETMMTVWEYSPAVDDTILNIALAPQSRTGFPSTGSALLFSFIIVHCNGNRTDSISRGSVLCSLFCGFVNENSLSPELKVNLFHSIQLSTTNLPIGKCLPFIINPVGAEHLVLASDQGMTVLGWHCEEKETTVVFTLVEVAKTFFSNTEKAPNVISDVSVHRHFESTVLTPKTEGAADVKAKHHDPKKMLRLARDQYSSSVICFRIYVAICLRGIEIFEFTSQDSMLERKGFIGAEGFVLTNIIHNVSKLPQDEARVDSVDDVSDTVNVADNNIHEEENKFKGSLLCLDRHTGSILYYDRRQRWINQSEKHGIRSVKGNPILLSAHSDNLIPNAVSQSFVSLISLSVTEFSVCDSYGCVHVFEVLP